VISVDQLTRLVTVQHDCRVPDDAFKAHLLNTYGVQSCKSIPQTRFEEVLLWLVKHQHTRRETEQRAALVANSAA